MAENVKVRPTGSVNKDIELSLLLMAKLSKINLADNVDCPATCMFESVVISIWPDSVICKKPLGKLLPFQFS